MSAFHVALFALGVIIAGRAFKSHKERLAVRKTALGGDAPVIERDIMTGDSPDALTINFWPGTNSPLVSAAPPNHRCNRGC